MGSSTKYPTGVASDYNQPLSDFSGGFVSFEYDHESRNLGWWFDYEEISDDFRADLGFIPKVGFRNFEGGMSYNWYGGADNWWRSISIGNEINYFDDRNGSLLYRNASLFFRYDGFLQSNLLVRASRSREASVFYRVFFYYFEKFLREYEDRFEKEYGYFRPVIKDVVENHLFYRRS